MSLTPKIEHPCKQHIHYASDDAWKANGVLDSSVLATLKMLPVFMICPFQNALSSVFITSDCLLF